MDMAGEGIVLYRLVPQVIVDGIEKDGSHENIEPAVCCQLGAGETFFLGSVRNSEN